MVENIEHFNKREGGESGIKHREIEELREPIRNLLAQLRESIDRGEYGLIIGDDASGRIPARIFQYILKEVYKEKGFPIPKTRFVAGSKDLLGEDKEKKQADIKNWVRIWGAKDSENRKILIVTDYISTGESLEPLTTVLQNANIPFDVATISLGVNLKNYFLNDEVSVRQFEQLLGGKIFYGQRSGAPMLYYIKELSGVSKKVEDTFSTPRKDAASQLLLKEARADARVLARELAGEYIKGDVAKAA